MSGQRWRQDSKAHMPTETPDRNTGELGRRGFLKTMGSLALLGVAGTRSRAAGSERTGGTLRWEFETGATISSPTVVDGTVYVGGKLPGDTVHALDAETGEKIWGAHTGTEVWSSPAVTGGSVFVGRFDNNLYALDANTGEERWRFETDWWVRSSPTVVDGTVYVASSDGHIYALEAGTDGNSGDSRVMLGTLGHHEGWDAGARGSVDRFGPGFGVGAALAGLGGAGYLLRRTLREREREP